MRRQQYAALESALLKAFPSSLELKRLADLGLDVNLEEISSGGGIKAAVYYLIRWARARGRLSELIETARTENPGNVDLARFVLEAEPEATAREVGAFSPDDPSGRALKLQLYVEGARAAAQIATAPSTELAAEAERRFWELYWGPLSIVEDDLVEGAMVAFGAKLENWRTRNGPPPDELKQLSLALAQAMRASLGAER